MSIVCLSQIDLLTSYDELNVENVNQEEMIADIEERLKNDIAGIDHKHKSKIKEAYTKRRDAIVEMLEEEQFVFDERIDTYFQRILNRLITANPKLASYDIRLLISRSSVPNASCYGEGTIVFNLGLVRYLQNEEQVAFVIAHEIAHLIENHPNKATIEAIEKLNSKEVKSDLNSISRTRYGKTEKALSVLKDYVFDSRKHSRYAESEADMIGLELIMNANIDPKHAVDVLSILDIVDQEKVNDDFSLKRLFDFADYPFKSTWLEKEELMLGFGSKVNDFDWNEDSTKTHPDVSKRIAIVGDKYHLGNESKQDISLNLKSDHARIVQLSDLEIINYLFELERFDRSFYLALEAAILYPENSYTHLKIVENLYQMNKALIERRFGSHVRFARPKDSQSYATTLDFLNNLRRLELVEIAYQYVNKYATEGNEDMTYAQILASSMKEMEEEKIELIKRYKETFKEGKYLEQISNL